VPEGDTVHRVAARLGHELAGEVLRDGRLRHRPDARFAGRRVGSVYAHGKHLFLSFDDGTVLRSHLGMWGEWHRYPPGAPWRKPARQAVIRLDTAAATFVCFNAREAELLRSGGVRERHVHARLGDDLAADAEPRWDRAVACARDVLEADAIAADVLLDQRPVSGIGNVYKSEVLFLERVHPGRPLADLADADLLRLWGTARDLLRRNLGEGPRVTRFEGEGKGRLWVYGRPGRPCRRCAAAVSHARMGRDLRSTYWCGGCQPGAPGDRGSGSVRAGA
jgi:endonuclease-8